MIQVARNNIVEQDHVTVQRRTWPAMGSFRSAGRTLQRIEAVNMIRKSRVRWLAKGTVGRVHLRAPIATTTVGDEATSHSAMRMARAHPRGASFVPAFRAEPRRKMNIEN
jgi:hypothetical protein